MRSTFKDGQRREMYSIDGHEYFEYKENIVEEDERIDEAISLLRQNKVVNDIINESTFITIFLLLF